MRILCCVLIMALSHPAGSAVWVWQDSGSACGATFQACLDTAVNGDTIYLKTDAVLAADLNWSGQGKAVSLIAVDGHRPVIDAPMGIHMESDQDLTIEGITLEHHGLQLVKTSGTDTENRFRLVDNDINNHQSGAAVMVSQQDDANHLRLEIINNRISQRVSDQAALVVTAAPFISSNDLTGLITGNHIQVSHVSGRGVDLMAQNQGLFHVAVMANQVLGAPAGAVNLANETAPSEVMVDIKNNAFLWLNSSVLPSGGVHVSNAVSAPGSTTINVHNNTWNQAVNGLVINNPAAENPVVLSLANNLMSTVETGLSLLPREHVTLAMNERNYFQNIGTHIHFPAASGTNVILPVGVELIDRHGRLVPESVAIDDGSFVDSHPFVDADGQYRSKEGGLDVGAFEAGSHSFEHKVTASGSHVSLLDDARLNGLAGAEDVFITPVIRSAKNSTVTHNYENAGLYYNAAAAQWAVFNEGFTDLPRGVRFNVLKTGPSANTFGHTAAGSTFSFTRLNNALLDNSPDKILHITQNWTGVYNPHPVGVYYSDVFNDWYIYNLDGAAIPSGAHFNVYVQDASQSAWVHEVTAENRHLEKTFLDHPMVNGNRCVEIQVTQDATAGVFNDQPIGLDYDSVSEQWTIANISPGLGAVQMPLGARFHVLVTPSQFAGCDDLIFTANFDPPDAHTP